MAEAGIYYRHSGKFGPAAPALMLLAGGATAIVGGAIYGIAIRYIPFIYVNFLLAMALGFSVGSVVYLVGRAGRARSPMLALLIGLICGFFAEYAAFVAWIAALYDWELEITFIVLPWNLVNEMLYIADVGAWSFMSSDNVSGVVLYLVWLVEAGIIMGIAAVLPYKRIAPMAFCEACSKWVEDKTTIGPFEPVSDPKAMRRDLEQGEFAVLGSIEGADEEAPNFTLMELARCDACDDLHLLTISSHSVSVNKKGESQTTTTNVVRNLVIDAESRDLLLQLAPEADDEPLEENEIDTEETEPA
jgi:hypothetical protein